MAHEQAQWAGESTHGDMDCRQARPGLITARRIRRPEPSAESKGARMYKFIGGVVVYGFALVGLAVYLDRAHGDGRLFAND